jgi:hypothetical protein
LKTKTIKNYCEIRTILSVASSEQAAQRAQTPSKRENKHEPTTTALILYFCRVVVVELVFWSFESVDIVLGLEIEILEEFSSKPAAEEA